MKGKSVPVLKARPCSLKIYPQWSKNQDLFPGYYMDTNGEIHKLAALSQQKYLLVYTEYEAGWASEPV